MCGWAGVLGAKHTTPMCPAARAPAGGLQPPRAAALAFRRLNAPLDMHRSTERATLAEPGATWAPWAFAMQSVHLYSSRPTANFKNGDMDATFMQNSPVDNRWVHVYSGRATMRAKSR